MRLTKSLLRGSCAAAAVSGACRAVGGAARSRRARALRLLPRRAAHDRGRARRRSIASATRRRCSITATSRRCAARSSAARTARRLARLSECAQRDVPAGLEKRFAAEAWVLVAACALVAGDERRREQALALARERDDDNPRIALVEAWALERRRARCGAPRAARCEARGGRRGVRCVGAVDRRSRLGSRRGVDGARRDRARARSGAHGARSHRASVAAGAGLPRGGRFARRAAKRAQRRSAL